MIDYESSIFDKKTIRAIDNGTFRVAHEEFSLGEWATGLYDFFLQRSRENKFSFKSEFGEVHDDALIGDAENLSKAMMAIFELASVVIPQNRTILFRVEQLSDFAADYTFLRLVLRVSGQNVRKDAIDTMVLSSPITAGEDAAHLLSLTKKLLALMHGSLTLQVREGKDVTFTVAIPLYRHSFVSNENDGRSAMEDFKKFHLEKVRVLAGVESKLERDIILAVFERFNIKVDVGINGGEIYGKFMTLPPDTYKCIIMDTQLKNMTGFEVTEKIRKSDHPQADVIPIIGMADSSFTETVALAFEAGMNDCLSKPVNFKMLLKYLACLSTAKE